MNEEQLVEAEIMEAIEEQLVEAEITQTIFEKINAINLCYSVVKSVQELQFSRSNCYVEYFILAHKRDEDKLKNLGFIDSESHDTIERTLTDKEIFEFKGLLDNFKVVNSDKDGKVYEIKDNSFKKYYIEHIVIDEEELTKAE